MSPYKRYHEAQKLRALNLTVLNTQGVHTTAGEFTLPSQAKNSVSDASFCRIIFEAVSLHCPEGPYFRMLPPTPMSVGDFVTRILT